MQRKAALEYSSSLIELFAKTQEELRNDLERLRNYEENLLYTYFPPSSAPFQQQAVDQRRRHLLSAIDMLVEIDNDLADVLEARFFGEDN